MKKYFLYLVVLLCTTIASAQDVTWQKDFDDANNSYEKEHYKEAVAKYKKLADQVDNSPELYFNLANAYYKTQDNVNAVYYFEKALKLTPNDKNIQTNLSFARENLEDDITIITEYDNRDIIHHSLVSLTPDGWAKLATVLAFIILATFILFYLSSNGTIKRITLVAIGILFIGVIGSIMAANFEDNYSKQTTSAIIFSKQVDLKDDAKSTAQSIKTLHEGTKVYILETKSLWIKVRLDNQEEGWIEKNTIREI